MGVQLLDNEWVMFVLFLFLCYVVDFDYMFYIFNGMGGGMLGIFLEYQNFFLCMFGLCFEWVIVCDWVEVFVKVCSGEVDILFGIFDQDFCLFGFIFF